MSRFILRCLAPDVFMIFRNLKMGKIREKEKLEMCLLFGFFSKFYFEGIYVLQSLLQHIRKMF